MKNISKESRKTRIKLITFRVLIPLILLFITVAIGLTWWKDYNIKHSNIQNIESNNQKTTEMPKEILDDPNKPKYQNKVTDTTVTKSNTTTGSTTKTNTTVKTATKGNWWDYPSKIYTTLKSGNDLLVLVNKTYKLPSNYAPSDLVNVNKSGIRVKSGGTFYVRNVMINDLKNLNSKAKADGIDLSIISAYRSYSDQVSTYNYWVSYNGGSTSAADHISARAGHSQHQLGTAVDFSTKEIADQIGDSFTNTKAGKWLATNAWKYGFALSYPSGYESITGYSHESWHFRYIGVSNSTEWHNSSKILELWLREKNGI